MASDLFYFNLLEFYQISGTMNGKEIGHQSVTALHIFCDDDAGTDDPRGGRAQQQPAAQSYGASSASAHYYRSVVRSLGPVIVLR